MTKTVLFEPSGRIHPYFRAMLRHAPDGFEFTLRHGALRRVPVPNSDLITQALVRNVFDRVLPVPLLKAFLESLVGQLPREVQLTYAFNHVIFRPEPWVVHMEWPHMLTGWNVRNLARYRGIVERLLSSSNCRKIIVSSEVGKQSLLLNLDCTNFGQKIVFLPLAAQAKNHMQRAADRQKTRLIFVGTANIGAGIFSRYGEFAEKGGHYVIEAFLELRRRYENVELVLRSSMPPSVRRKIRGVPNIRVIDQTLSPERLDEEFRQADIFLFPGHHTPWCGILEAMSYALPVVATDFHFTGELIEDGVTGFLVRPSSTVPQYWGQLLPAIDSPLRGQWLKAIAHPDPEVVRQLVQTTSLLIDNPELRARVGAAARREVQQGRFSIRRRNERLKEVLDEATEATL
jgi:glycosyltransferase involved in cell wall biosynthesis